MINYILKNEGYKFIFQEIRENTNTLSPRYNLFYKRAWEEFVEGIVATLQSIFSQSSNQVIFKIFTSEEINKNVNKLVNRRISISCDSCVAGDFNLGISRIFKPGETVNKAIGARPGYDSIKNQIHTLISKVGQKKSLVLIEDDIFTGNTVKKLVSRLKKFGINIEEIIVTFQVGKANKLDIPIKALYKFIREEIFELNDFRDFVMGGHESGLVIVYPYGIVKAPYCLPFCSTHARLGIPEGLELDFSKRLIELNRDLFYNISKKIKKTILLSHVNYFFQQVVIREGIELDTSMSCVCQIILNKLINQPPTHKAADVIFKK